MQNNTKEEFVPLEEAKKDMERGDDVVLQPIHVGAKFTLKGQRYRIRKITHKDIICRPIGWVQDESTKETVADHEFLKEIYDALYLGNLTSECELSDLEKKLSDYLGKNGNK